MERLDRQSGKGSTISKTLDHKHKMKTKYTQDREAKREAGGEACEGKMQWKDSMLRKRSREMGRAFSSDIRATRRPGTCGEAGGFVARPRALLQVLLEQVSKRSCNIQKPAHPLHSVRGRWNQLRICDSDGRDEGG